MATNMTKHWAFTLLDPLDTEVIDPSQCAYLVVRYDTDDGLMCLNGYVEFKKSQTKESVCEKLSRAVWRRETGRNLELIETIKRDSDFMEHGSIVETTKKSRSAKKKTNWNVILQSAREGDLESIDAHTLIQYYTQLKQLNEDYKSTKQQPLRGTVITGRVQKKSSGLKLLSNWSSTSSEKE